jgi:peptidoglycan hydrolase-like protein with peptidoglycan-binding domain
MALDISAPVGASTSAIQAVNDRADVKTVQGLLNVVPVEAGGPDPKLDVDGRVGPKTISAISAFQQCQFGFQDGLVEPGKITLRRLNELASQYIQQCGQGETYYIDPFGIPPL